MCSSLNNFADSEEFRELCKYMEMDRLSKDITLFEQGDPGDNFYIIFSGKVSVYSRKANDIADTFDYTYLCDLVEGDSFGELSLIYGAPRAATIRTKEATDLIVISKAVYDRVIKNFQVEQIVYIVDFYSNLVIFQNTPKDIIIGLATKTQVVKVKSNEIFVREGDVTNMVWFIYIGKANIVKNVRIGTKRKNLAIDSLGSTDIFGHHRIKSDCMIDYTVITQLPSEFFGITKADFLSLPQDIKDSFFEYAKPYPDEEVIRQNFYDNKKWKKFQNTCRNNIMNDKISKYEQINPFKTVREGVSKFINPIEVLQKKKKKIEKVNELLSEDSLISSENVTTNPSAKKVDSIRMKFSHSKQNSVPNFKLINNLNTGKISDKSKQVPEFKITLHQEVNSMNSGIMDSKSISRDETEESFMKSKLPNNLSTQSQAHNAQTHKNTLRNIHKKQLNPVKLSGNSSNLDKLSIGESTLKGRAKSVCRFPTKRGGEEPQNQISPKKSSWYGKRASSTLINEEIKTSPNYYLNKQIKPNIGGNSIKIDYESVESTHSIRLLADRPLKLKGKEASLKTKNRDVEEFTEPMTPVKYHDIPSSSRFRAHNHNIMQFINQKNYKIKIAPSPAPPQKKSKLLSRFRHRNADSMPRLQPLKMEDQSKNKAIFSDPLLVKLGARKNMKHIRVTKSPVRSNFIPSPTVENLVHKSLNKATPQLNKVKHRRRKNEEWKKGMSLQKDINFADKNKRLSIG